MDAKMKTYIGYILYAVLILTGLNALMGGNPVIVMGLDLLPVVAVLTTIYHFVVMRKK